MQDETHELRVSQGQKRLIEVELTGWAYGGEALGRSPDGLMIFAPFCLPGEAVRGPVIAERTRWARILPQEVLLTSPERIDARCPHFTECGGCHYQHLSYDKQLATKSAIVIEQLQRIGGFENPPVTATIASPKPWEYRNHMRYHVLSDGSLGFIRYRDTQPLPVRVCFLPEPDLQNLWQQIDLPAVSSVEQVSLRMGTSGDPMVILHGDMDQIPDLVADFPASIVWQDRNMWRIMAGESAILFEIEGHNLRVSPPSFFQVNTSILPTLVGHVMSALQVESGMSFFDLYAGVGLFSRLASERGAHVFAIEESNAACADFEVNLRDCDNVSLYEAPVEQALPAISQTPDVVLVDPPRSGLSKVALDAILRHRPSRLVYLSCDLGTLSRDAKRLHAAEYQLEQVVPIDIFPQTFHIETLSSWHCR